MDTTWDIIHRLTTRLDDYSTFPIDQRRILQILGEDEQGSFWQIGVIGHGPRATELAGQVATAISEWDRGWGHDAPEPSFRMAVGDARDQLTAADPRFAIDKTCSRLVVDWPRRS
ncbi:hypothetical protein [Streptomyces thioluteus]|uniref:hypothetical protein n=1 Tax=Streptomyces thioluteus TaxID=66431 RepID=UPI0031EADA6D